MLKRIVKLTFRESEIERFKKIFEDKKERIRAFEGCHHLELWQSRTDPRIFFTYSYWDSEKELNLYRHSDLFKATWKDTKALFDGKPEAWSVDSLELLP